MKHRVLLVLLATFLVVISTACRDTSGGDPGAVDASEDGSQSAAKEVSLFDVHGDLKEDEPVVVRGVVVTAVDMYKANRTGSFWVQDPKGGPYSGVLVYNTVDDLVKDLKVGDLIDLENVIKDEFPEKPSEGTGRVTELKAKNKDTKIKITKVGTAAVLAPQLIDPVAIAKLPDAKARDDEWEKWEGVLVKVEKSDAATDPKVAPHRSDPLLLEFNLRGPLPVDSGLMKFSDTAKKGTCFSSLTGVLDYDRGYRLYPRDEQDLVVGTDCMTFPEEAGEAACKDGGDEDFDGLVDCADSSCQLSVAACVTKTTVAKIATGETKGFIKLEGVVVTAVHAASFARNVFVADSGDAGPNNGLMIFQAASLPEGIKVGSKIDVSGEVTEHPSPPVQDQEPLTQLAKGATITPVAGNAVNVKPVTDVPLSTLLGVVDGEPYESVLVTLSNVEYGEEGEGSNKKFFLEEKDGSAKVYTGTDANTRGMHGLTKGKCYSAVTGVMGISKGVRTFHPRSKDDSKEGCGVTPPMDAGVDAMPPPIDAGVDAAEAPPADAGGDASEPPPPIDAGDLPPVDAPALKH